MALAWVVSLGVASASAAAAQAPTPSAPASSAPASSAPASSAPALTPVEVLTRGMSAYAEAMAEGAVWRGARVPWPAASPRPEATLVRGSTDHPLALHAGPGTLSAPLAERWIAALDRAYERLADEGWPLPPTDGGRGDTDGFDVYVLDEPVAPALPDGLGDEDAASRRTRRSAARLDVPWYDSGAADGVHDAALVHAVVASDVPLDRLESCAVQLLASAGLFAADPAEAESLREGTAAWLAWATTGQFGCDEDALVRQQRASFRAFITPDPRDGEGSAIVLGALAARHDGYETGFLRDVWWMARQKTRDHGDLRADPDVLRVLYQASLLAHDPLDRAIEAMAVERYFGGDRAGRARPHVPALRALPGDALVPVFVATSWERLPRSLVPALDAPPIYPWGSAYARIDVSGAPPGSRLRIWLDGEFGTEWALVAVRLDARGEERGRTRAPPTRNARGFIPLELGADTAEVLVVVTNLPDDRDPRDAAPATSRDLQVSGRLERTGLDADAPGPGPHGFRLIVDPGG